MPIPATRANLAATTSRDDEQIWNTRIYRVGKERGEFEPSESKSAHGSKWVYYHPLERGSGGQGFQCTEIRIALEQLCRTYWYPLYAYVRRRGKNPHDAQDLTQEFFAHLFENNFIGNVDSAKGKFRSFLLAAMNNFLANESDRSCALKRGGGKIISLDSDSEERYRLESSSDLTADVLYERRWAQTVLSRALRRLQAEFVEEGKKKQFDFLKGFLEGETDSGDYVKLAQTLSMTPGALAVSVHRLRQRYHGLIRAEIAHTVTNPAEVDDEMRFLLLALTR